jgi:hypothetical protein
MARWPKAAWRPLPEHGHEGPNRPTLFVVHTMVGWNAGTEQWFRRSDVNAESHFGLADDPGREDPIRQWLDTDEEADTNWDANGISVTVECEDRGDPTRPFSSFQLQTLVDLGDWACTVHPIARQLADDPRGSGLGYHQLHREWNRSSHDCPGPVRRRQLLEEVFPEIIRRGQSQPPTEEDDMIAGFIRPGVSLADGGLTVPVPPGYTRLYLALDHPGPQAKLRIAYGAYRDGVWRPGVVGGTVSRTAIEEVAVLPGRWLRTFEEGVEFVNFAHLSGKGSVGYVVVRE